MDSGKEAIIETVRVRLIRMLEQNRQLTYSDVAKAIGRSEITIGHFIRQEAMSWELAKCIASTFGEIGEGIICRECGQLRT